MHLLGLLNWLLIKYLEFLVLNGIEDKMDQLKPISGFLKNNVGNK